MERSLHGMLSVVSFGKERKGRYHVHRYILILTQTIKNTFLVKFSPTQLLASSGLLSQYCRWTKQYTVT